MRLSLLQIKNEQRQQLIGTWCLRRERARENACPEPRHGRAVRSVDKRRENMNEPYTGTNSTRVPVFCFSLQFLIGVANLGRICTEQRSTVCSDGDIHSQTQSLCNHGIIPHFEREIFHVFGITPRAAGRKNKEAVVLRSLVCAIQRAPARRKKFHKRMKLTFQRKLRKSG